VFVTVANVGLSYVCLCVSVCLRSFLSSSSAAAPAYSAQICSKTGHRAIKRSE